jgi:hypothetical protein
MRKTPCYGERMEHQLNEDGEHDEEGCYECLLRREVKSSCRCAECCKRLIIEVGLEDAEREPKIKELGSPLYTPPELTASGQRETATWFTWEIAASTLGAAIDNSVPSARLMRDRMVS